jgi:hypothetical protein
MILGICDNPDILKVLNLVKILISAIKVIVPIMIIVMTTITFTKAVYSDKEDIFKAKNVLIYRCIAAAAIFFVPTLVSVVINLTGTDNSEIKTCMNAATPEGISASYTNRANRYLDNVKNTLSSNDYFNAMTAINDVDDNSLREELNEQLKETKTYVDLMSEINNLALDYDYKKLKEIKTKIDAVTDETVKEKLTAKYDEIKESIFAFIGEYPIVPFGEHELYTGLKTYTGDSLDNLLKRNGSSAEELDEKIKMAVEYYGVGTRKATVAAAITLIGSVAETGYQLPYFWGGKWAKLGVNPNWGTAKTATSCNENYFDTQEEIDACKQRNKYWAMDCSGFVNWSVIQGVQEVRSQQNTNGGKVIRMNSSTADHAVCDIGDALGTTGHIVLVVGLDDENKRYIIAEESMGLEIDDVPYSGNLGDGYYCIKIDDYID